MRQGSICKGYRAEEDRLHPFLYILMKYYSFTIGFKSSSELVVGWPNRELQIDNLKCSTWNDYMFAQDLMIINEFES